MSTTPAQAVLFDFDGTLAPNLDLPDMRRRIIDMTLAEAVPQSVFADHYIVEIVDVSAAWLATNRDAHAAEDYFERAHALITEIEILAARTTVPFQGVPEKLNELRERGYRLGVVTRNCRAAVLAVFPQLLSTVDALHARDDVDFLKPDLRHLERSLQALQCAPSKSVMVGDGQLDMRAGAALGLHCIGVLSGSSDRESLLAAGASEVLDSCLDLTL